MEVEERLLKYISIKTPCDENSDKVPTTSCQFNLAKILADELKDLGLTKVILDDKCFVYGILPATPGYETRKKLGFIAHMFRNSAKEKFILSVHQIIMVKISSLETVEEFLPQRISHI